MKHLPTQRGGIARQILCAVIGLGVGLATYLLLLLLADTVAGSRQISAWLLFESRSGFIRLLLADLLAAAPVYAPALLAAAFLAIQGRARFGSSKTTIIAAAFALLISALCMALGFQLLQATLFGAAILAAMLAALLFARIFVCSKAG